MKAANIVYKTEPTREMKINITCIHTWWNGNTCRGGHVHLDLKGCRVCGPHSRQKYFQFAEKYFPFAEKYFLLVQISHSIMTAHIDLIIILIICMLIKVDHS